MPGSVSRLRARNRCARALPARSPGPRQAMVARLEFADHAPGDVGDDDEAGPHLGIDRRRDPYRSPCARQVQGEGTVIACLSELIFGYRVVLLARTRRPGDGAPGEAGEGTGALAGVGQQGILADSAGPHDGDEGAGTNRLGQRP